ncbi:MAG: M48 family metallopeptidase [Anaerovoracaceae bacterium]
MNTKRQERTVCAGEKNIKYILERKQVKNINLRVRPDGSVKVSASPRVDASQIDDFVLSKAEFILKALKGFEAVTEAEEKYQRELGKAKAGRESLLADPAIFTEILDEVYPAFIPYGIARPKVRIRTMKSCWGSCLVNKGIITLNRKLLMKPRECIEYVVVHELCHFVHPNHSKQFYGFMEQFMPDWKERKRRLNEGT